MNHVFRDRADAGDILADRVLRYRQAPQTLILALPCGGVPVGAAVARRLDLPFDVLVIRKVGAPGNPELALGAVGPAGVRVMNTRLIEQLGIPPGVVEDGVRRAQEQRSEKERLLRGGSTGRTVRGKSVLLVDDGVATGATICAAVEVLRREGVRRIVLAVPTMPRTVFHQIRHLVDEIHVVTVPDQFDSVGEWYEDFAPVTDAEVSAWTAPPAASLQHR